MNNDEIYSPLDYNFHKEAKREPSTFKEQFESRYGEATLKGQAQFIGRSVSKFPSILIAFVALNIWAIVALTTHSALLDHILMGVWVFLTLRAAFKIFR